MSNTNDPTAGQPNDPKKPEKKPEAYQSAFDFGLPEGTDTFSDIAPPAPPSTSDPEMGTAAPLPPRPEAPRTGSKNSFEFTLSDAEFELPPESGTNLHRPPRSSDSAPDAPKPPAKSDSGVNLGERPKQPSTVEVTVAPVVPQPPSSITLRFADAGAPAAPQPPSSATFELPPEPPVALPVPTAFDIPPFAQPPSSPTFELPPLPKPPSEPTFELPPIPTAAPVASAYDLPDVPAAQPLSQEFDLPPVPGASEPTLADASGVNLGALGEATLLQPASDVFDLPFAEEPTLVEPVSGEFDMPVPEAPLAQPASDVFKLPPVASEPFERPSSTFELPPVPKPPSEPVVSVPPIPKPPSVPDISAILPATPPAFTTVPTPLSAVGLKPLSSQDLGPVVPPETREVPLADLQSVELAQPLSGLDLAEAEPEPEPPAKPPAYASAFDFALPEGADTFSDIAPPAPPSTSDPEMGTAAPLPPKPEAHHGSKNSFEFTLSDPNLQLPAEPAAPARPPRASDPAPVPAAPVPSSGSVPNIDAKFPAVPKDPADVFGDLSAVQPVQPVSDWLDSEVIPAQTNDAGLLVPDVAPPEGAVPGAATSDIFGGEVLEAEDVDGSNVLSATGSGRGSSVVEYTGPGPDAAPVVDEESIHDIEIPEEAAAIADEPDYAAPAEIGPDASSILSELADPRPPQPGDSSGIRLEAPGDRRTLEGAGDQFDITMLDEPVPADLEAAAADNTDAEGTDWEQQSGSDLFAERRTAPDMDLAAEGRVNPVNEGLESDQPSLTSDPQSIFAGVRAGDGSSTSMGSGNVRIGAPSDPNVTAERDPARPPAVPPHKAKPSSAELELPPARPGDSAIGFDFTADSDDANVSRGASPSELMAALKDDSAETPTREKPAAPVSDGSGSGTKVTVDWMSGSNEEAALEAEQPSAPPPRRAEKAKEKPAPKATAKRALASETDSAEAAPAPKAKPRRSESEPEPKQKRESRSLLVGALLGGLLAGGAFAGVYFGGVIPNGDGTAKIPNPNQNPIGKPPEVPAAAADPGVALLAGNSKAALELINKAEPKTVAEKATAGQVRLFARLQELGTETAKADDAELLKARAHLEAVVKEPGDDAAAKKRAVAAAVQLGVSYEVAGDAKKAREVFEANRDKFPDHKAVFDALIDRLDAAEKPAGAPLSRLNAPDAERLLLALAVALVQDGPKGDEPAESGTFYWKAVNQAAAGKYAEAQKLIAEAKAAHEKRARALAGRGLNPLTDPLEQMFPRACTELSAYWELRSKLYGSDAIAAAIKKDGLEKALAGFATAATELAKVQGALATAQGELKAAQGALTKAQDELKTVKTDYATAKTDLEKAQTNFKTAKESADKFEKDLGETKKLATKYETDAEAAKKLATKYELEADTAKKAAEKFQKESTDAKLATAKAEAAAKSAETALAALAKELGAPEKATTAEVLAAAKSAMARGTGPDLSKLIPKDWKGGTLTAAQLEQLGKDLAAARKEALAAAKKAEGEVAVLKAAHAKELDAQKVDAALAVKLEKEAAAKALKDLAAKYDTDAKFAATKAAEALAVEMKKTADAVKALADQKVAFEKQLANAVTPTSTMDLWLPVLTDLRRASDSPAARAAAEKALAASAPNSEDAAKAQTVNGMARLNAGDFAGAKEQFLLAKRSPAFEPNAEKSWAKTVVLGLEAVDDPLALYRQKVETPATDARLAARALDAGVAAYRGGRYDDAARELSEAVKNAPADPVAWYYLGATKWARGEADAARKDFAQGAEREKVSPVPSRIVSSALSPVQGAVRDALDRARP